MSRGPRTSPAAPLPRRGFLGRALAALAGAALFGRAGRAQAAPQEATPFLGEIIMFAGTFAPRGWAFCNGQLLPINQNQALFSLLGTTYGGNGQTTFALPDLRGRVAIHHGQGPGLSSRTLGERAGAEHHTLSVPELPAHTHVALGSSAVGSSPDPAARVPARNAAQIPQWGASPDTALLPSAISNTGGNQPHNNMQPFTTVSFIIALQGFYPSYP